MRDSCALRARLLQGNTVFGPFVHCRDKALVEILGQEGYDFIIVDTEHGATGPSEVEGLVRAANGAGLPATVRVRENTPSAIARALDTGAQGVMVPHVSTEEAARKVADAARFAPQGERGVDPYARAAGYGFLPSAQYFSAANERTLVVVQIEGREGVANVEAICQVPGIDCVFTGPFDLSQSLGYPGQPRHPQVVDKVREVVDCCDGYGIATGVFVADADGARLWRQAGVRFIAVSMDVAMFRRGARELHQELHAG
jgi:4-hydroxy-2-oxoheptanedioate aldolase